MIILHGGWQDGRMLLWAEQSPDEVRPEGNGHPAGNEHPYCADHGKLVNVLASAVPGFRVDSGDAVSATAWLPSRGGSPIPSSALVADPSRSRARPRLMPWSIPAYRVSPADAIPIFQAGKGQGMLTTGVSIGGDLAYWSQAVRFSAALVARQQFLPGAIHDADGARAAWVPLFIGADAERLARLSQRMPASARALSGSDAGQPPDQPAATVLRTFVAAVADSLIRSVNGAPEVIAPKGRREKLAFDSVHDAWLSGLKSIDGAVHGTQEQLGELRAQVVEWQRPIALTASAPFRVCFRLEEPPEPPGDEPDVASTQRDGWYLRYLLQSHADRSLLLPASAVWKTGGQRVRELERDGFNPREFLLASLGQASGICAGVADSLHRKRPAGRKLDAAMAYQFLTGESIALEEAGYGIILPAWWTRRGTKTKPTLRVNVKTPQMQGGGGVSLATMLELNLEVALGDQVMTARELEALAQLKTPLVRLRGQWVELNASEIRAALDFWNRKGETTLKDVIRLAVGSGETPGGFDVDRVAASGWVDDLLGQLTGRAEFQELETPEGFCGTLRPYQQRGYSWLAFLRRWGLGACLADDMGLGKAQPLDAPVLTPAGYRRMGELLVGDLVIGGDGHPTAIISVYPQGPKQIYRVTLSDGTDVECCAEHLWTVTTGNWKSRKSPSQTLRLGEIMERGIHDAAGNRKWEIPLVTAPVVFAPRDTELPMPPYLMGALLGDGSFRNHHVRFSSSDPEIIQRVSSEITQVSADLSLLKADADSERCDYRIFGKRAGAPNALIAIVHELGLMECYSHEKFIPRDYLTASSSERLELLHGLMDTDGYVQVARRSNAAIISTSSSQLADDIRFLAQSLGGTARIRVKPTTHRDAYVLTLSLPSTVQPFWLTRKRDAFPNFRSKYAPTRRIESVEPSRVAEAQCIKVANADGLYLTDHFVVTHNTVQTLAAIQQDRREGAEGPALLVCPTSVLNNWRKEAGRFTPDLPLMVHHGPGRRRDAEFVEAARQHTIVVASYGVLARDIRFMAEVPWRGIVLDEAQNIKNPATRQARAARSLGADYRVALTGTPVENHVGDLWSVMQFLNPGLLGTEGEFKRNYFIPIQAEGDEGAAQRLQRATGPFILRRLKTDRAIITDLPEKVETKEFCTLTREQATLYEAVLREAEQALEEAEGIGRRGAILGTLTKLKQVCNHPRQLLGDNSAIGGRSGKLARLQGMLEEIIAVGDRALVFSQFAEMGGILQRHIQDTFGKEALFLHGGVSRRQRDRMVERFQDVKNGPSVFILSLRAGGTGLNLTAANHVFHYDRWWNPAVENQATDRAFRIGQTSNVQVHKFMCAGTLEERIDLMIEAKQANAERVVGTDEGWLTELSNDELRDVLSLSPEAAVA